MSEFSFWLEEFLQTALCATAACFAIRWGKPIVIGLAWLIPASVLMLVGYVDWMDQTFQDTPLKTYIFGSVLSPLGALVAAGFVRREEPYLVRWLAAGLSAFLTYLAVTLLDFVGLL